MRHVVALMNRSVTRRRDERRLTAWLTASLVLHALILGVAGPMAKAFPRAVPDNIPAPTVLQALISHTSPAAAPVPPEPTLAPPVIQTPEPSPIVQPMAPIVPPQPPRVEMAAEATDGASGTSMGRITVGVLHDASEAGLFQATRLRDKYPTKAGREPRLRGALVIAYPAKALETRTSARIVAVLNIDAQGQLIDSTLVPNDAVFGPAVSAALKNVRFAPGEIEGLRSNYWMLLEIVFSAGGAPATRSAAKRP